MPADNLHEPSHSTVDGDPVATQQKMSGKKKTVFSIVAAVLFLGSLELVLVLAGIKSPPIDIYAEFSSSVSLFTERKGSDAKPMMVTADNKLVTFNSQKFAKNKPAGTYRIFCLGGSTTHGYPYDDRISFSGWLRELLEVSDPSRKWEVINVGGIGYATHRISLVVDELKAYEPDLFIIYAGHDAFLERETYASMLEMPPVLHGLRGWLSETRTCSLISSFVRSPPKRKREWGPTDDEDQQLLDNEAGLNVFHRDARIYKDTLADFRSHLGQIVKTGRHAGAKILFVLPASNLRDSPPWKSEHRENLTSRKRRRCDIMYSHADNAYLENKFGEGLSAVTNALIIDDQFAAFHYLQGQILDRLNRHDEARQAYIRARDEDIAPLRAPTSLQNVLSDVAAELKVSLLDFPTIAARHSDHHIPGNALFHDNVHLNAYGHEILALSLLDLLIAEKIVKPSSSIDETKRTEIGERINSRRTPQSEGVALANLANMMLRTGRIEEASRLSIQALELAPDDDNVQFVAGCGYRGLGQLDEAKVRFEEAIRINSEHSEAYNNLGIVFAQKNDLDQAVKQFQRALEISPNYAEAHNNLGIVFSQQEKFEKARDSFKKAVSLKKNFVDAQRNLKNATAALENRK